MSSNQEILERAITLAIDGGWLPFSIHGNIKDYMKYILDNYEIDEYGMWRGHAEDMNDLRLNEILFDKDFAKALWGETDGYVDVRTILFPADNTRVATNGWQYHLQQMVIAGDTIKYLGDNI